MARSELAAGGSVAGRALAALDRVAGGAVIGIMALMVLVVSAQVLLRYGFNSSLDWADDVGRLLFVWSIFLAIPLGIRDGVHIGIELAVKRLPDAVRGGVFRLMAALSALMMGVICWQSVRVIDDQWDEKLPTLDVTVAIFMIPVCFGAAHSLLHLLKHVVTGHAGVAAEIVE